ncbi:MAG: TonB-dependent receptor [Verrucomicrobia bacterium]|nr:TonB-dependent receptor [Verrucomicrobiota bacterium]
MSAADVGQPSGTETRSGGVSNQATGIVSGRVSNQATGDLLPGAIVQVEGSNISVSTDRDGYFSLSVPPGERTLLVQFTGLDAARVVVNVERGRRIERDVPLTSEIYRLEKFSVTGIREGAARAIQVQRQAPNIKTVVASDTFGNPASNPGELVGRMAGVTVDIVGSEVRTMFIRGMGTGFTSLLVDGNQFATSGGSLNRGYQIEQYGTGNIETMEVIKAPTPDMDATAIGGYINMISKRAYDRPSRQVNFTVGTNWRLSHYDQNPDKDRPDNLDLIALDFSQAYDFLGGKRNLGVSFNFSRRVASTLAEEYGGSLVGAASGLNYTNPSNPLATVFAAGFFGYANYVNYNIGFNVDYKFSERTVGYFRTTFNKNSYAQYGYQWQAVTANNVASFEPGSTYEHSRTLPLPASKAMAIALPLPKFSQNWSFNPGLEHKFAAGSARLEIDALFSHAIIWYPANVQLDSEITGVAWEVDRRGRDPWTPAFNQISGPSLYDPANYTPTIWSKSATNAPTDAGSLRVDFRKEVNLPVRSYIKLGAKYRRTKYEYTSDTSSRTYAGPDGRLASGDEKGIQPFLAGPYKLAGGRYGPFPMLQMPEFGGSGDMAKLPASHWVQTNSQAYNDVVSSFGSDASTNEVISAAYVSGHITLGKLGILAGLRFEDARAEATAFDRIVNSSTSFLASASAAENVARALALFGKGKSTVKGQNQGVFPGLHFAYEPVNGLLFRASYNKSISRPPLTNLLAQARIDEGVGSITQGNPNLKPYQSNNFEAGAEKYFEPVGMVSIGVFLKEISDYFRTFQTAVGSGQNNGFNGQYAGYTLNQVQNSGNARIRGVEFSHQQQYRFLPGVLKGLGSFANFTYQETQGNYGAAATGRLASFVPRSLNAGISYVQYGLQARLLFNFRDGFYRGGSGPSATYADPRRIYDLKLQYSVRPAYDVFLDVGNIFDEPNTTIVVEGNRKYFRQVQGVSFSAGIKARL